MKDPSGDEGGIKDYKFFCFNGKPEIMFIATDRATDVKFDFFDMDFNHLDITNIHPQSGKVIEKPEKFDEMKALAENCLRALNLSESICLSWAEKFISASSHFSTAEDLTVFIPWNGRQNSVILSI